MVEARQRAQPNSTNIPFGLSLNVAYQILPPGSNLFIFALHVDIRESIPASPGSGIGF
jgi:hypothetical protein